MGMFVLLLLMLSSAALAVMSDVCPPDEQGDAIDARIRTRLKFLDTLDSCLSD